MNKILGSGNPDVPSCSRVSPIKGKIRPFPLYIVEIPVVEEILTGFLVPKGYVIRVKETVDVQFPDIFEVNAVGAFVIKQSSSAGSTVGKGASVGGLDLSAFQCLVLFVRRTIGILVVQNSEIIKIPAEGHDNVILF